MNQNMGFYLAHPHSLTKFHSWAISKTILNVLDVIIMHHFYIKSEFLWSWPHQPYMKVVCISSALAWVCKPRWLVLIRSAEVQASAWDSTPLRASDTFKHNKACVAQQHCFSCERAEYRIFFLSVFAPSSLLLDADPGVGKPHFRLACAGAVEMSWCVFVLLHIRRHFRAQIV